MIYIDVETRSRAKLGLCSLTQYVTDKDFKIICLVFYDKEQDVHSSFSTADYAGFKAHLIKYYRHQSITLIAHNTAFEYAILRNQGFLDFIRESSITVSYRCTMSKCLAIGLPASLEKISNFIQTPTKKLAQGKALIERYSIPQSDGRFLTISAQAHKSFYEYCLADVKTTVDVDKLLPDSYDAKENLAGTLQMNSTGLPVDKVLAQKVIDATNAYEKSKPSLAINVKSPKQVKEYCAGFGVELANCQQQTIQNLLSKETLPDDVRFILVERLGVKSSVAKYKKLIAFEHEGRLHDLFMYYGAHTGRDTARTFQPQNLPRGDKMGALLLDDIDKPDVLALYGLTAPDVAKSGLRSIIRVPEREPSMLCADFSSIEFRVLLWLCKDQEKLDAIEAGQDMYKSMAAEIFRTNYSSVTDKQRHLGKTVFLGLGYGMGIKTFIKSLPRDTQNKEKFAVRAVALFRTRYKKVVNMWNHFNFTMESGFSSDLTDKYYVSFHKLPHRTFGIKLPSGRYKLYYALDSRLVYKKRGPDWEYFYLSTRKPREKAGQETAGIIIRGQQLYRHKLYGGILVHNVVQSIARDLLFEACTRLHKKGYKLLARVHDEVLVQKASSTHTLEDFLSIVKDTDAEKYPGLSLDAEGWEGRYYHK